MATKRFPTVSVIVPCYNGERFLKQALQSVYAQTYEDYEVIVVDDGSNDGKSVQSIVESIDDPRFKYLRKKNGGVASAVNFGISNSSGRYICWLSDDDLFKPEKLNIEIQFAESFLEDTVIYGNWDIINGVGELKYAALAFLQLPLLVANIGPVERGLCSAVAMMIPRVVFNKIGFFNEELKTTQDYDFFFRMGLEGIPFHFHNHVIASIRQHAEQETNFISDTLEMDSLWSRISQSFCMRVCDSRSPDVAKELIILYRDHLYSQGLYGGVNTIDDFLLKKYKPQKGAAVYK